MTPLGQIALRTMSAPIATLTQGRLGDASTDFAFETFRAPYGERWHILGTGRAQPTTMSLAGNVAPGDLEAVIQGLPNIRRLGVGQWRIPVRGALGAVVISPTLDGHRVSATVLLDSEADWEPDP